MSRSASARGIHPAAASPNRSTDEFGATGPYVPGGRHIGGRCDPLGSVTDRAAVCGHRRRRVGPGDGTRQPSAGVGPAAGPGVGRTPFFRYWTHRRPGQALPTRSRCPDRAGSLRRRTHEGGPGSHRLLRYGGPCRASRSNPRITGSAGGWIEDRGLKVAQHTWNGQVVWDGRFEFYPTDPSVEPDPEPWEIEVAYLLASDAGETQ